MLYSFFWVIQLHLNVICRCFRTLCSTFIGGESRKNNQEIVDVFIQEKVGIKNSLSQSEGGGMGPSRETGCGGQRPQLEASSKYVWKKRRCWSEKWEPRDGRDQTIVFQVAVFFFMHVQKGFPRFAYGQAIFSVHVVWVQFQFNGFPDELVHVSGFSRKMFCIL